MPDGQPKTVPRDIDGFRKHWSATFAFWYWLHYGLGFVATVLGVIVAADPDYISATARSIMALVAAVCTAILTLLKADSRGHAYRTAWAILNSACKRYVHLDNFTKEQL